MVCGSLSACLRHGPRGCFHSECCTGGESMAASSVNAEQEASWTGRMYRSFKSSVLRDGEPSLSALTACALLNRPFSRLQLYLHHATMPVYWYYQT